MPTTIPPASRLAHKPILGIAFRIVSVTVFLGMLTLVKTTRDMPIGQLLFFRSFFAILPIAVVLLYRGTFVQSLKTQHLPGHGLRAVLSIAAIGLTFLGALNLPLPDATAISYATPLIIVVLGALIFKENVRLFRGTAVLIGFAGVMIIAWPNLSFAQGSFLLEGGRTFGTVMAFSGAAMAALGQVAVRNLVQKESSSTIVLIFSIIASGITLLTAPFGWIWPDPYQFLTLVGIGILGGTAQICMTESFRYADMSVVAPFDYSSLILSIIIGYFVFAEIPTIHMLIGGAIVTAAGIAIIWRERHLQLERVAADQSAVGR